MSALKTPQTVTLQSSDGKFQALLQPTGAALAELTYAGKVIVGTPTGRPNYGFAGAVMAPWANRLAAGRYEFFGIEYQNPVDEPAYNTALHGLVFNRTFTVLKASSEEVEFEIQLGADEGYPFSSRLKVWYELTDFGLISGLEFTNDSNQPIPLTAGFHPYFAFDHPDLINLSARKVTVSNERLLPSKSVKAEVFTGKPAANQLELETLNLDNCFDELITEETGWHYTVIDRQELQLLVQIGQSPEFERCMIYTMHKSPITGQPERWVAVEPQAGAADAFNSGQGLVVLESGQTFAAEWSISVEPIYFSEEG